MSTVEDDSRPIVRGDDGSNVDRLDRTERRWARGGALAAVLAFWLLATCMQPWNLFAKGPFSTDFYDAQARALTHGHLDVPSSVAGIEGFVVDGRTQIYFGLGPAVLRLPLSGVSDVFDRRLSLLSELAAVAVLGLAAARLLKRARALVTDAPRGAPWWYGVAAFVATAGTPLWFLASAPLVYHEAELWGAAAGLAGLDLVLRWWRDPTGRHLAAAVAVAAFAMWCRPSSGASPAIALGIFGLVLLWRRDVRRALLVMACAVVPIAAFAAVNWLRFRSFSDVPFPKQVLSQFDADRQATLEANDGSLFGAKFVPTNVLRYLSPFAIRFDRLFPFVSWPTRATVVGDVRFDRIDDTGSIVTSAPLLFLLALVGSWWTIVRDRTRTWTVLVIAALASTVTTFTFGFMAHRYLADLVPVVVLLAAPAVWVIVRATRSWSAWTRRGLFVAAVIVFALGAWNQLGLAITTRAFTIVPNEAAARSLAELQYSIDDTLFGGRPPAVTQLQGDELPATAAPGTIAIAGDCEAVYRRSLGGWIALERRVGGGRRFVLDAPVRNDEPLVSGDGWSLTIASTDRGSVVRYRSADGVVDSAPIASFDGSTATFDVVADPLPFGSVIVRVDDHGALDLMFVGADGARVDGGRTSRVDDAPFCSSLVRRLGD